MPGPLDLDDPNVVYYGAPPAKPTPGALDLDDPNVLAYYGAKPAQATPGAIDLDAPLPYQPNPGAPNYNPNPGSTTEVAPLPPPAPPVLGAQPPTPTPAAPLSPAGNAFKTGAQLSSAVANAPPPQLGPTAADDAAFERAKAQAGARSHASGGAGGPVNTDPFGSNAANRVLVGSLESQAESRAREGNAEADRIALLGEHKARIARMQEDDATIARLEEEEASKRFDAHMQQMQQRLDDVASKKVDPQKYMNDRAGFGFMAVLGGLVGGLYQGLNKLDKNPFLTELNGQIDRQMMADEKNLANERAAVGDQMNLLAMNRAAYKDKRIADSVTRAMYLEAAKAEADAQLAGSDSEIAKARAQQGVAVLEHALGQQKKQIANEARAQSAAQAAAMYARQKERQSTFKDIYKEGLDKGLSPAQAESEAMRISAILYAPQLVGERPPATGTEGEFDGLTVRDRSHMKREEVIAQKEAKAELDALRTFKTRIPELAEGSAFGDYYSGAPGFLPGVETAKEHKLSRESYNATVARAYDAAMKAAQGAAPTESQKAQLKTFYIENNDDDAIIAKKINAAEEFVVQAGRAKGLHDSTPRETAKALGEKPIR